VVFGKRGRTGFLGNNLDKIVPISIMTAPICLEKAFARFPARSRDEARRQAGSPFSGSIAARVRFRIISSRSIPNPIE